MFRPGDRIRMKIHYAAHQNSTRHHSVDWAKREGIVIRVGKYNNQTKVLWDDRKSPDHWPTAALEKIEKLSD